MIHFFRSFYRAVLHDPAYPIRVIRPKYTGGEVTYVGRSIAHMGYVVGGIFSMTQTGMKGAVFQMLSHGLVSSALFLIVGILYQRGHTKEIAKYGGVVQKMPILGVVFMIVMLGSIGLPGTSGFIGEFLSIAGIFESNVIIALFAATGIVLGAVYMLRLYKFIMFGPITNPKVEQFGDLFAYEKFAIMPLVFLIILLGLMPNTVMLAITSSANSLINILTIIN